MSTVATKASKPRTLSLDFGNYILKSFGGHRVKTIRSLQTPLAQGKLVLRSHDQSPIVEQNGQRWHLGSQCRRYTSTEATVLGDKAQLAQLHLAACIAESADYQLVVSHHSPHQYEDFLRATLLGEHRYLHNGNPVHVTVQSVDVVAEGWGAYQLAKARNYVPQRGYTILIDLGGSTWLSSVYAADGELIAHDVHERQGTFALAASIAKDTRLSKPLLERFSVTSPDPVVVQDGFLKGHFYGDSDLCWADWLSDYLDPWWKGIIQTLKARYQSHLPNVRRFLITGGGSNLITHKVAGSPAFLVLPEASTANVQGAFFAAQPALVAA
ncbi:MAG: hypothetical protein O2890_13935 [Cyanobacteria bacterium]|nr:hypothetical protein [Cyanobacteriota bacterium]MDA0867479.1 hypothetical protein [Cyanobacteriota bacterium]